MLKTMLKTQSFQHFFNGTVENFLNKLLRQKKDNVENLFLPFFLLSQGFFGQKSAFFIHKMV